MFRKSPFQAEVIINLLFLSYNFIIQWLTFKLTYHKSKQIVIQSIHKFQIDRVENGQHRQRDQGGGDGLDQNKGNWERKKKNESCMLRKSCGIHIFNRTINRSKRSEDG